jgi:hypothetical protein
VLTQGDGERQPAYPGTDDRDPQLPNGHTIQGNRR